MTIDHEEHRELLTMAVANIPISGPAGAPELLAHVNAVHNLLAAIAAAQVAPDPAQEMLESR